MMRSMYSGVAGLKTHQTKMDVIGNNIANVNTVGFKSMNVTFNELMYQTTQKASGPNAATGTGGVNARQIGLGVKMGAINTNITQQGATQTTNNPFDIQITGDAFFVVSNGSENFFTRDGSFYVDGIGNLCMTSNGYNVMGWQVDPETMNIRKETVSPLRIMSADNMTYPPEATSKAYVSGIMDKNDTDVTSKAGKTINLQLYDSLGYLYTAKLNFKSTDTEGTYGLEFAGLVDMNNQPVNTDNMTFGNRTQLKRVNEFNLKQGFTWKNTTTLNDGAADYDMAAALADLNSTDPNHIAARKKLLEAYGLESIEDLNNLAVIHSYTDPGTNVTTDTEVLLLDIILNEAVASPDPAVTNARDIFGGNINKITTNVEYIQGFSVVYDASKGTFVGIDGNTDTLNLGLSALTVTTPDGQQSKFSDIEVDFTQTTMFNNGGTSTLTATNGDINGLGSGRKLGKMIGVSVQNNGMIYASYDNGQTKLLGQIAVAEFANASGLEKAGDNLYSDTLNSGEFDGIGVDITANGGYMNTGVLEMSNVDLSAEFTEMITTQRGFQANSRIITVSDTMLEELVNLKR
ncbi:MAG: flagellar hook protein FlgE [Lachnospiraceae bacterium]